MDDNLTIQPTPPQRHRQALERLFSSLAPSERVAQMATTMAALRDGRLSRDGLWEAVRGEALVGCAWANVIGGRAALIWPAQLISGESESTADLLFEALDRWLGDRDVRIANAFLADDGSVDSERLLRAGFQRAAEILYLVSEASSFPDTRISAELEFEEFSESKAYRLAAIVEQTYQDTLDCPMLDGQREMDDVFTGYRQTGVYDPSRWFIVRSGGADIGCLILTDHPADNQWELVYQGVVPKARGNGFGLEMTRHAQWLTGCANRSRLVLAVDAANQPAIRAYTSAGFQQWDRRFVLFKPIS